jgi:maleate isomerase
MTESLDVRIGVLVPASNVVVEAELPRLFPPSVSMFCARVGAGGELPQAFDAMSADLEPESRKLAQVEPHAVAYACTSGSFDLGGRSDAQLRRQISKAAGAPATTATSAALWRLRELEVERIVFCSPYETEVHEAGVRHFEASGFHVTNGRHLGLTSNAQVSSVPGDQLCELVRQSWVDGADAVFLSCTGLRTSAILGPLAQELGVPVVSANAALAAHVVALATREPVAT